MRLHIALRPDDIDGGTIAECPEIPGCMSEGATEEEAVANLREAIGLCLEVRRERGMPLMVPLAHLPHRFEHMPSRQGRQANGADEGVRSRR